MQQLTLLSLLLINFHSSFGHNWFNDFRPKRQQDNRCRTPSGQNGRCIVITECSELLNLLSNNKNDPEVRRLLLNSQCGYAQNYPKVCCPQNSPVTQQPPPVPQPPPIPEERDNSIPNHLPQQCGKSDITVSRIVGGRPASLRAWPWMALLGYRSRDSGSVAWKCGGTLVSNRHVVTAAHCLGERVLLVRLGDLDISRSDDGAVHVDVIVEQQTSHRDYNKAQHTTDIGILRLKSPVTFSADVQPICLPFSEQIKTKSYIGFFPYIAGWGSLQYGDSSSPTHLMEAQVEVKSTEECSTAYAKLGRSSVVIDNRVICAGGGKKDACQGDSGGPLMTIQPNGRFYLLGVVSYGYKCAEVGYPGIYTRVSEFVDWISANTV